MASPEVVAKIRPFQVLIENIGSRLTQAIASLVLENVSAYKEHWLRVVSQNRKIVKEVMGPLQGEFLLGDVPSDGCIFFPKIVGVDDASGFTKRLEAQRVFVVPGRFFGAPAHVRIGFGGNLKSCRKVWKYWPEKSSLSSAAMNTEISKHLRYNLVVNVLDGSFFGFALGFASFVTILPLFVSTMTSSAILIGLVPAIHNMGWQLPQLLTAGRVARLSRYKPMVILMTIQERLPYLGLAAVAWFLPELGPKAALLLTFGLLTWQGLGGGFTATAWQSMIGKIIPARHRGTFFGTQAAAANLFASSGAVMAGILLERLASPLDFTLCFLLASVSMAISWVFLARTREPDSPPADTAGNRHTFWSGVSTILRRDANFRWFLAARMLSQLAMIAFAFYTVYAVRRYGMSEGVAGLMTGVLLATQIAANPIMGWVGDRWSHRAVMEVGALAAAVSALVAWAAPDMSWFYLVFGLAGIANVAFWTVAIAMTLEFGTAAERPAYIGLANTLAAPSTILAPLVGGWLADATGYQTAFLASAVGGLATALVLHSRVRDPRRILH